MYPTYTHKDAPKCNHDHIGDSHPESPLLLEAPERMIYDPRWGDCGVWECPLCGHSEDARRYAALTLQVLNHALDACFTEAYTAARHPYFYRLEAK
jgi:hypothetical protein